MYREVMNPNSASAMSGNRWAAVEGLYVHPGGTPAPSISMRIMMMTENVITRTPTSVSLR